jgi:hypothetical protein
MKITDVRFYGGARQRVCKLGMTDLYFEVQEIVLSTEVKVLEERNANGGATLRKMIDAGFETREGWVQKKSGGTDWQKRLKYNQSIVVTIGVEVQVSARSDLIIRDVVHLRNSLQAGEIEVGLIVLPSNQLQVYLPDRTPCLKDALRIIETEFKEATTYPVVVMAIEHDGPSDTPLPKQKREA